MQRTTIALIGALSLALPGLALADHHKDKSEAEIPQPQAAAGDFQYVTGGVGEAESAAMEAEYGTYALKLVNVRSGPESAYVSNVDVTVANDAGDTVLESTTEGPWLLADMPAGTYEVKAAFEGNTKTRTVTLDQDADQRLVIDWRT